MPHTIRHIESLMPYEVVFRAKNALTFPCAEYMNAIIKSILSRVQRDNKVILHHYIFEVNHVHILCTVRDIEAFKKFYCELEKQLTEAIKRLTGLSHLNLWMKRPNVCLLPTLEDVINKISYIYSNPSNDGLVDTISEYRGVSSYEAFKESNNRIDYCFTEENAWIRQFHIPMLPSSRSLTIYEDLRLRREMIRQTEESHTLMVYPNSYISTFIKNVTIKDVREANEKILYLLNKKEELNRKAREEENKKVVGVEKLRKLRLLKPHIPKKNSRRVFVQTVDRNIRFRVIDKVKRLHEKCRELYERHKKTGEKVEDLYPFGTYPPAFKYRGASLEFAWYGT